jgi:membrane-associated phospholipid phosphatase
MAPASPSYKFFMLVAYIVAYVVFYTWPNSFPLFTPKLLPLSPIDEAIPFVPWTFAIYLSDYVLALFVICSIREKDRFLSFSRMAFGVLIVCGIVFMLFPTAYPRPEYPSDVGPLIRFFMNVVSSLDQPTNCFPSHHVAAAMVATWNIRYRGSKVTMAVMFWSLLIFVSTLTTKQHYFVDILGGVIVAALVIYLDPKVIRVLQRIQTAPRASL